MEGHNLKAIITLAAALAVAFALGCGGSSPPQDTGSVKPQSDFDSGIDESSSMSGTEIDGGESVPGLEPIYFDFDRAVIRDDQKPTLRSNSSAIAEGRTWRTVVVEGHTDERGSEEYNLALGERRANSVRAYLINLGIGGSALDTVSFGESKPAVQGHDESAWRWNRRAEFRVVR